MTLTRRDVESIAQLARLEISEQELPVYAGSLSADPRFVEQLSRPTPTGVEPMAHPLETRSAAACGRVTETDQRDRYQGNAPAVEAGLYLVPKVIE